MSLLAIIWTTVFLTWIQIYFVADDVEDLALAYLLPTILIAVFFGSTLAIAGSFVSALAAAYFLYPPKFSLYIADPTHAAELGFILLLSVTASKATGVMRIRCAQLVSLGLATQISRLSPPADRLQNHAARAYAIRALTDLCFGIASERLGTLILGAFMDLRPR